MTINEQALTLYMAAIRDSMIKQPAAALESMNDQVAKYVLATLLGKDENFQKQLDNIIAFALSYRVKVFVESLPERKMPEFDLRVN